MPTTTTTVTARTVKDQPKRETCSFTACGQRCVRRPHKGDEHRFPVAVSVLVSHRPVSS